MPLSNFDGYTFVAYLDISGFKKLIKQGDKAWEALDKLYQLGYDVLRPNSNDIALKVEGLFVSDCGILFVRGSYSNKEKLLSLLKIVEKINRGMLKDDFMLTTSIAYGHFKYQERIVFKGIVKNLIYGGAYISSYSDTEIGKPTIQPGQCRIIIENLPPEIIELLEEEERERILKKINKEDGKHYYFYWNVENPEEIEDFKKRYNDSYNLKYAGMLKALRREND